MRRAAAILAVLAFLAVPARASDGPKISLGYSFLKYLETDGGSAPVGAYFSGWGAGVTTIELDLAWHRKKEDLFVPTGGIGTGTLNTFTFLAGPRQALGGKGDQPYAHLLGGARLDRIAGESITSWGGAAGLGIDLGTGGGRAGTRLHLGVDFEMFFDDGENVKALRFTAGLTF
jgi:hypothetical protein